MDQLVDIEDKVIWELEVAELGIEQAGKDLGLGGDLAQLEHGGGEVVVLDANELLEEIINLGNGGLVSAAELWYRNAKKGEAKSQEDE